MSTIPLLPGEIFKPHPYYSKYQISNLGRVLGSCGKKLLKCCNGSGGYTIISLSDNNCIRKSRLLHRLVVETFIGTIPKKMQVDHINGIKSDNKLANLEIVTRSENSRRAFALGLKVGKPGSANPQSVLKETEVLQMYDMVIQGLSNKDISEHFGVHERYVSLVRHGERWKHLYSTHKISTMSVNSDMRGLTVKADGSLPDNLEKSLRLIDEILNGDYTRTELANRYGLCPTTISHIKWRSGWKQVWEVYDQLKSATTIEQAAETQELSRVDCKPMAVEKQGAQKGW